MGGGWSLSLRGRITDRRIFADRRAAMNTGAEAAERNLVSITRFSELPSLDAKDAEFEVDIGAVQTQGFVHPHSCRHLWMARTHPDLPWCRYTDDGLAHCRTKQEAEALKAELQARLAECHLEMHPTKAKVVYCKDEKRKDEYTNVKFDFLVYCFRLVWSDVSNNQLFCGFNLAVSSSAMKACGKRFGT